MNPLCREVQKFVSACEALHWMLSHGSELNDDERGVVTISARDLLAHLSREAEKELRI